MASLVTLSAKSIPVGDEMRRNPAEVAMSTDLRKKSKLPPAFRDDALESCGSRLVSFSRSAFTKNSPGQVLSSELSM